MPATATLANYTDAIFTWGFPRYHPQQRGRRGRRDAALGRRRRRSQPIRSRGCAFPAARWSAARSSCPICCRRRCCSFRCSSCCQRLGLIDSKLGLIVAYLTFTVPFCTWLLIGYFRTIPDGTRRGGADRRGDARSDPAPRVLPIALPGLAVVALYAFTHSWNEFLYALVYVYSADAKTFTAGLTGLMMGDTFIWGQLMASSVIAILPVLVIYLIAQKLPGRGARGRQRQELDAGIVRRRQAIGMAGTFSVRITGGEAGEEMQ